MLLTALTLLLQTPSFDTLAARRDADALLGLSSSEVRAIPNVFRFLKGQGAYGVGRFGWRVEEASAPTTGTRYAVFTTRLTSEDIGEPVFEVADGKLARFVPELEDLGVQIRRHDITATFVPGEKKALLVDRLSLTKNARAGRSFLFRMSPNYEVESVRDAQGKPVEFSQAGGVVLLPTGAEAAWTYSVSYTGIVDQAEYAGAITDDEVMLTNDYWYPMIARLPAPYSLTATVPSSWTAVGQGDLVEKKAEGNSTTYRFEMKLPAIYYSFSAGPFDKAETTLGRRRYTTWSRDLNPEQLRIQNELNHQVVEFYSRTLSPYPFGQWGSMVTPLYGGGALEAYSFATYGTGWLPGEDGHEPAHTWWGGIINNTYLRSFWNESFAVYSNGLYQREGGVGNVSEQRLAFVSGADPSPEYRSAPLVASGASIGGAAAGLGYGKGAKVLQVLEAELGTPTMIKTLQTWLRTHPKGKPGEWEDYEKAVRQATGQDITWFFDQWMRRTGWPEFEMKNVRWTGREITGVAQFTGSPYRLKVEALVRSETGKDEFSQIDLKPDAKGSAPFRIACRQTPALVSFDPWRKLLRRYGEDEAPPTVDRVWRMKRYTEPGREAWIPGDKADLERLPDSLDGVFVVGSPETLSAIRPLCERLGVKVVGETLTWRGTTVDLRSGGALTLVDLPGGGRCGIGLGTFKVRPSLGRARLGVFDGYGRFLRGVTEPKTQGLLTYRLGSRE